MAYTTDQTVTRELERQKAEVSRLTCTGSYGDKGTTASATAKAVVSVHCEGRTDAGQDITVDGKVTKVVNGACVRGNLTAKVDGKEWFRVKGLGDCDATSAPPADRPSDGRPGPTVTVTRTIWCPDDPHCGPVEGK
ncbi:lipoprotein [Streptomyces tendae]|nr:lipoprotein [Streptomyces tendae]